MHAQIKHSLAHLQDLIPTLAGVFTHKCNNYVDMFKNALAICTYIWLCVLELIVTDCSWCIIVT